MKALILAGGKGSRLRPITYSIAKQLVPVANKPVIEYGIDAIREAGIDDFGFIVGDTAQDIMQALGDGSRWDAKFTYIKQEAPLGLAHAVKTARTYLGEDRFVMYLGDNLIKTGVKELVNEFRGSTSDALILLTEVPNPSDFGVAELDDDRVIRLEEKPKNPKSNFALVGVYMFTPAIFDAIETLQPSFRGEYEITDAIQALLDAKKDVRSHIVTGWWKDTGTVEAMLDANRLILESMNHSVKGDVIDSKIAGAVTIESGARVVNSLITGPAIIGANCLVKDSTIGPYTSIAEGTTISHSTIEFSIVMNECTIKDLESTVFRSLIGRGVVVKRASGAPNSVSVVLGDNSTVEMP
jgi:glucose-1-phosphate thymidylyltransferase